MAPFIAALLKAGLPLLANAALAKGAEFIEEKTGVKVDTAVAPTDAQLVELRRAEMQHEEELLRIRQDDDRLALQFAELTVRDVSDARKRDTEFIRAGQHNWRADILAALAVVGLVVCVWFVARDSSLPERAVNAVMFVAGVLAAAVRDVYGFEFGSSRGSKEKDDILRGVVK
jgi:hypothetical protein